MPLQFTCPHCGSVTLVDDQYSDQSGPCVACGKTVRIPKFAVVTIEPGLKGAISRPLRWVVAGLIGLLITGVAIALVRVGSAAASKAQAMSARGRCMSNLQRIAKALKEYADDHGKYPPPFSTDAAGKPLLSWRVHILPYLNESDLHGKFSLGAAWDSPGNFELTNECPAVFRSPGDSGNFSDASYMLITGPGTLFPPTGPLGLEDIPDGFEKTLLVVETARPPSGSVPWSKPVDLDISRMSMIIGGAPGIEIGGTHPGGAVVVTADERAHFLRDTTSPMLLRSLISPAGGEAIRDDALD